NEGKGLAGGREPGGLAEGDGGVGEGRDHQAIPVGEDLVVPPGPDARFAGGEKAGAAGLHLGFERRVSERRPAEAVEDGLALPVAAGADAIRRLEERGVVAQHAIDLRLGPDVELALLALAVRIEAAGESLPAVLARRGPHFAKDPADRLSDAHLV